MVFSPSLTGWHNIYWHKMNSCISSVQATIAVAIHHNVLRLGDMMPHFVSQFRAKFELQMSGGLSESCWPTSHLRVHGLISMNFTMQPRWFHRFSYSVHIMQFNMRGFVPVVALAVDILSFCWSPLWKIVGHQLSVDFPFCTMFVQYVCNTFLCNTFVCVKCFALASR